MLTVMQLRSGGEIETGKQVLFLVRESVLVRVLVVDQLLNTGALVVVALVDIFIKKTRHG